jgi:hypothetical protein
MCHRNTILKYPDSLLAQFLDKSNDTRTSELDYITLEKGEKYFATMLNLMRSQNSLYVQDLSTTELDELQYYKLHELSNLLSRSHETDKVNSKEVMRVVLRDFDKILSNLKRPTIVIGYSLMYKLHKYLDRGQTDLYSLFDYNSYDVCLFFDDHYEREKVERKAIRNFRAKLYLPSQNFERDDERKQIPVMVYCKDRYPTGYEDESGDETNLVEFLAAVDVFLHQGKNAKARLEKLSSVSLAQNKTNP